MVGPATLPDKMPTMLAHPDHTLQLARETLDIEAAALLRLKDRLDERFVQAVNIGAGRARARGWSPAWAKAGT